MIKEAAASLAQIAEEHFWTDLSHQRLEFLRNEIKPLFRTVSEVDFKALRFERDLLEYSLAQLSKETELAETLKDAIVEQIFELPLSVNFVQAEATLIRHAQTNAFWSFEDELHGEDCLDELNEKLGPLMKFRESQPSGSMTYVDFQDEVIRKEFVEFGPKNEAVSITRYREMVESLIVELTDHNPVLLKIRNGEEVTESEATELAELLHSEHPHITEQLLQQVYQNRRARFLQFIGHILGIEVLKSFPETVSEAFDQFIQQHSNLNSRQLEFLSLLKGFILEREKVEKKDLISSPFTILHPQGIRGIFGPAEINEILILTAALAS